TRTNPASGRASATTTTGTHGASSGTKATRRAAALADGPPGRTAGRVARRAHARPRRAGLAGARGGTARRPAAHGGGRVQHPAQLLPGLGTRRREDRTDGSARRRRRGLPLPHGRPGRGRSGGAPWTGRRLVRVASGAAGTGPPRGRGIRPGAVDGHDPGAPRGRQPHTLPSAVRRAQPRDAAVHARTAQRRG